MAGSDPAVVGKTVRFNGEPHQVIGVLQPGVAYPNDAELWQPMAVLPEQRAQFESRGSLWLSVVARLKPGVTIAAAEDTMLVIERRLQQAYPGEATPETGVLVARLHDDLVGSTSRSLWLLQGSVVSAIGIYGVTAYSVSRRMPEFGVLVALGAQRRDVLALVLRHGLFVVATGSGIGILGALLLTRLAGPQLFQVSPTDPQVFVAVAVGLAACALARREAPRLCRGGGSSLTFSGVCPPERLPT